eukprot:SAG11_NODE_7095_length_1194_cov_1.577169_1_plen_287_part_01
MSDVAKIAAERVARDAVDRVDSYTVEGGDAAGLLARGNHAYTAPVEPAELLGTAALETSRAYAHDLETTSVEDVIQGAARSLREYGFCVLDHVVPRCHVKAVAHEISDGMDTLLAASAAARPRHDALLQPLYCEHVAHPAVLGVAQEALDAHVRIGQWGRRNIPSDDQMLRGQRGGFGPAAGRGKHMREYHTDWPHDMEKGSSGNIRQPFPDVCMALSMVWYLTDVGPDSGGTTAYPRATGIPEILARHTMGSQSRRRSPARCRSLRRAALCLSRIAAAGTARLATI